MKVSIGDLQWWWDWRVMVCSPFCDRYERRCHQVYVVIIGPITFSITLSWHDDDIEYDREEDGRCIANIPSIPGCMTYGKTWLQARRKVKRLKRLVKKFDKAKEKRGHRCMVCNIPADPIDEAFCPKHLQGFQEHMKKVESDTAYMKHIEEVKKGYKKQ